MNLNYHDSVLKIESAGAKETCSNEVSRASVFQTDSEKPISMLTKPFTVDTTYLC